MFHLQTEILKESFQMSGKLNFFINSVYCTACYFESLCYGLDVEAVTGVETQGSVRVSKPSRRVCFMELDF